MWPIVLLAIIPLPIYQSFLSFRQRLWSAGIGHLLVPLVAASAGLLGFFAAPFFAVVYVSSQLSLAFALFHAGIEPPDKSVEIISVNPEIAAYHMGYIPGFLTAGTDVYFVFDPTGKLAGALGCRSRELAGNSELGSRNYGVYRGFGTTRHIIGAYYEAQFFDDSDVCP